MATGITHPMVVVGVDGSPAAKAALQWAVREAALRNASLLLVYAMSPSIPTTGPQTPPGVAQWQKQHGRRIIDDALKIADESGKHGRQAAIDSELVFSGAVSGLVDLSKEAELIVIGGTGRGGLRSRALGSISSALVQHAQCPVAVIRDADPPTPHPARAPVLVGVDGSPSSELATALAFYEASLRNVGLVALHACSDGSLLTFPDREWPAMKSTAELALADRLESWRRKYPGVAVRPVVVPDEPARRLLQHSETAQLIVVGSHGRGGYVGMLVGAVAAAVVQSSQIPVIVARQPQA
jgi:nucleotide-binding universal stress UspA family protein